MLFMPKTCAALLLGLLLGNAEASEAPVTSSSEQGGFAIDRVVLFARHGVRPPTKSAQAMGAYSDKAWPNDQAWGAAPAELTPHGALAIAQLGRQLRHYYTQAGLLPAEGSIANQTVIWADGADQRTRETAKTFAVALNQTGSAKIGAPISVGWSEQEIDPLIDSLGAQVCKLNPDEAKKAVLAQGAVDAPELSADLAKLQTILAPQACQGGAGTCFANPNKLVATEREVKISGPLSTAATVTEAFLLEYENALPMEQVAFGRTNAADIGQLLSIHEHTSNLTRRTPYIAQRRAFRLVQFILAALSEQSVSSTTPAITAQQNLILLAGHDTNLSNLAGVFGLAWQLPDQPDSTAPGTTLAFERWRNAKTGQVVVKMRVFYQGLEQVRQLLDQPLHSVELNPALCKNSSSCELDSFVSQIKSSLPNDCAQ